MIELEWERSGVPFFAYPAAVRPHHGVGPARLGLRPRRAPLRLRHRSRRPPPHRLPDRDPLARRLGVVPQHRGRSATATSPRRRARRDQDPWIWYEGTDHKGVATTLPSTPLGNTPVQATVADAFFSTYGGNIPEALNGCDDSTVVPRRDGRRRLPERLRRGLRVGPAAAQPGLRVLRAGAAQAERRLDSWCGSRSTGAARCPTARVTRPATTSRTSPRPTTAPRTSARRRATSPTRSCRTS